LLERNALAERICGCKIGRFYDKELNFALSVRNSGVAAIWFRVEDLEGDEEALDF